VALAAHKEGSSLLRPGLLAAYGRIGDQPDELAAACFGRVSPVFRRRLRSTRGAVAPSSANAMRRARRQDLPRRPPNPDACVLDIPSGFFNSRNDMHEGKEERMVGVFLSYRQRPATAAR
jgi:hypothetical protein